MNTTPSLLKTLAQLKKLGFEETKNENYFIGPAESIQLSPNIPKTFKPVERAIFVADMGTFFYVTSNMIGKIKSGRDIQIANIFAHGKTANVAIKNWIKLYKARSYNVPR